MDHESTPTPTRVDSERLILPPISAMDGFFASRSWPPPSTTLSTIANKHTISPSSSNSYLLQENLLSPTRNNNDPWSPNKQQSENQPSRLDYFNTTSATNTTTTTTALVNTSTSTNSSYSSLPLSPMDDISRYQNDRDTHYRQSSLPQIPTFRKNSIHNIISPQQQLPTTSINQQSVFKYQPNNLTSSTTTTTTTLNNNHSSSSNSNNNNNITVAPIEFVLTPNSLSTPSLRNIEKDIEEVSYIINLTDLHLNLVNNK